MVICGVYRSSLNKAAWLATFHDFLDELHLRTMNIFLLGDFNFDQLKDDSFPTDIYSMYDLKQLITMPTRIAKTSATLLDHIYVRGVCCVCQSDVKNIHISDHCLISCTVGKYLQKNNLHMNNRLHRTAQYCCIKNLDINTLKCDQSSAPWSIIESFDDVDDAVSTFRTLFTDIWNIHTSLKKV